MDLIERIKKIINDSELSSAGFADQLGVQRSSISHILSGRNKPSLDFILKLLNAFPTVASDWLLFGEGTHLSPTPTQLADGTTKNTAAPKPEVQDEPAPTTAIKNADQAAPSTESTVERVVIFYSDGSCSTYTNKKWYFWRMKQLMPVLLLLFLISCFSPERNCTDFHTGTFSFTSVVLGDTLTSTFVRNDSIEVDYYLNRTDTASVRWLNDCECIVKKLHPLSFQESKAVHMKILTTKENAYTFEYNLVGDNKNKQRGRVTKLSN